jgi:hypothetical protein
MKKGSYAGKIAAQAELVNVPRTGTSYRFVHPLVMDETTALTFRYRR